MNIKEAIEKVKTFEGMLLWIRPVGWCAHALMIRENGRIYQVPSTNGRVPWIFPTVSELTGEWETVDPQIVLDEAKEEQV
jgi:hypothetical protein